MTYCVAIRLKVGMIFASDTRTNAGIDNISTLPFERCTDTASKVSGF